MPCSQFFYVSNESFNDIRENNILTKISKFTVAVHACLKSTHDKYQNLKICPIIYQHFTLVKNLHPYQLWLIKTLHNHVQSLFGSKNGSFPASNLYGSHMGSATGFHMGPIWAGPCK